VHLYKELRSKHASARLLNSSKAELDVSTVYTIAISQLKL